MKEKQNQISTFCAHFFALAFVFLMLLNTALVAQEKEIKKGIEHYEMKEFTLAVSPLKKAIQEDPQNYQANKLLGNVFRKLKNYEQAELYFEKVVAMPEADPEDYLYYGQVLMANNKLEKAVESFQRFAKSGANPFLGELMIQSIKKQEQWALLPKHYKIDSLFGLNSRASEFGIQFFQNQFYIASSRGENYYSPESPTWTGDNFLKIFVADTTQLFNSSPIELKEVSGALNSLYHDGPLAIEKSEEIVAVSRVGNKMKGKDFVNRMKLYLGEFRKGKWKNFQEFPFNSDDYSVGHACFADSGKTMYFSSNMPGGYGEMDLYVSRFDGSQWTEPENLGRDVNTPLNEVFPFFHENRLYFSSEGHVGYGGLDIFYIEKMENQWAEVSNLKAPINSNRDDFSIYFLNEKSGFFASNRIGGQGKDDIYFFEETKPKNINLHALFEYNGLPQSEVKVNLLNENDSIIASTYTDEDGKFSFENLPYDENYLIQLEAEDDSLIEDGRLFIVDKKGEKLQLLHAVKNGKYEYKALPIDEIVEINRMMAADESELFGLNNRLSGTIYKRLPGDFKDSIMVYVVNDSGEVIDSVWADENGSFSFKELPADGTYLVQINSDDPALQLAIVNEEGRMTQNLSGEDGLFKVKNQKDASKNRISVTNEGYTTLIARIEHQGEPVKHQMVKIYNKDRKLLASVLTNAKGEFQFNELQFDDNYFIELPAVDSKTLYESVIYVQNEKGEALYLLNQLRNGEYVFNSLPFDEYDKMQAIEEAYVPMIVKLVGQLYEKLPGDYEESILVYAVDESGTIIDSAWTDEEGKFTFQKLKADESYTFKMRDGASNLNMAILDENDIIVEQAKLNEAGNFAYEKLTYQIAQYEKLKAEDPDVLMLDKRLRGQVFKKLPGDYGDSLKVYIYDAEGSLIATTYTDAEGKFEFSKLDLEGNYFFEVEDANDNFQLVTLDDNDNVLHRTIRNQFGQFTYSRLKHDKHKVKLLEVKDQESIVALPSENNTISIDLQKYRLHYRFDRFDLQRSELKKLNEFVQKVKGTNQNIQVISHTDIRGPKAYNVELSKKRSQFVANYLSKKGINKSRIHIDYKGELQPLIDCEKKECNSYDHRLNRRSELKLLQNSNPKENVE